MTLTNDDLREIFELFCSVSRHERAQAYAPESLHYFKKTRLEEEYELHQEKGEFARDAWRAVIWFLHSRGYSLVRDGTAIDLAFIDQEFTD